MYEVPPGKLKINKPDYAKRCEENAKKAHEQYYNVLRPVAKDTNKTRRPMIKPTVGQIKR